MCCARTNVNRPKGQLADGATGWEIQTNDQLLNGRASMRRSSSPIGHGRAVRLADVAKVDDSVEDLRTRGWPMASRLCWLSSFGSRVPISSTRSTVFAICCPQLQASIPGAIDLSVVLDRTTTIRASLHDVEMTLMISVLLVILVVFVFLRSARATIIPGVAVPVSLIGTFGVMYLLGYSLDNLSLMALTIATGFVVDDAIVVLENISAIPGQGLRHLRRLCAGRGRSALPCCRSASRWWPSSSPFC